MKTKRLLTLLLSAVLTVGLLAGCGSSGNDAKDSGASQEAAAPAGEAGEAEEITFDGESESAAKIKSAMEAYDAAMDKAAGMPDK